MENNKAFELFTSMIDTAIDRVYGGNSKDPVIEEEEVQSPPYKTLDEYTQKTGKRFRINKVESELGLTREEALQKRFNN
tara:strand:+ start:105 stop:341 length:237 start_codon:yes stop_codon:yes gene_type:complete